MLLNIKTKTGLLFGSFNPVHNGHILIARYMLNDEELDEIWFVVSPHNPLKASNDLAPVSYRLAMLKIAIASEPRFSICELELTMPTPSYTINTLKLLTKTYPGKDFSLIIGADNLIELRLWKNYRQILRNFKILVYPRAGVSNIKLLQYPGVKITNAPMIDISSSTIRHMLDKGEDVLHLLPAGIADYIKLEQIYSL